MSTIAERFEERNRKFLSNNSQVQKTNTIELRNKNRSKMFQHKRIFPSDRFDDNYFEALILSYPQLQSQNLSIQEKYELVLSLFNNSLLGEIDLLLTCLMNFCKSEPVPKAFISVDISKKLVEIIKSKDSKLISKALFVIINGTYLFDDFKYPLLRNGAVEAIIEFSIGNWDDSENVADSLWSLSHLAQNEKLECLKIISSGLGDFIISKISSSLSTTISVMEFSLCLLSAVFKTLNPVENPLCDPFLTIVPKVLSRNEPEILTHCFWILSNICQTRENIKKVIKSEILNRIYYGLNNFQKNSLYPVYRLCGHIAMGTQEETETIFDLGILDNCFKVLIEKPQTLTREALWIMLNLAVDRESYRVAIIDHSNFKFLLQCVETELLTTKINALECLSEVINLENYEKQLSKYKEILPCLVESLKNQDARVLTHALNAIQTIFMVCNKKFLSTGQNIKSEILRLLNELGGVDLVYKLNSHPNSHVYQQARYFILVYLNEPLKENVKESNFEFS